MYMSNLEQITNAHCFHNGELHYQRFLTNYEKEKMSKETTYNAYCLLNATNCPFYQLHKKNDYCVANTKDTTHNSNGNSPKINYNLKKVY